MEYFTEFFEKCRIRYVEEIFQGKIKGVIMAVELLPKPCNIKDIAKIIKKQRRNITEEKREEFDQKVQEGLKDFIRNYFK